MIYATLVNTINAVLAENYPIEARFNQIRGLSHFSVEMHDWDRFLPFQLDIDGTIRSGAYKHYRVRNLHNKENGSLTWKQYVRLYVSLLNTNYSPVVAPNKFLYLLHSYNYVDALNIKEMEIGKDNNTVRIEIAYTRSPPYTLSWSSIVPGKIGRKNHFYFESFDVVQNKRQLRIGLMSLFARRDSYDELHFHLDNNGGGDIVPAHLILRCLLGAKRESWMRNIRKITHDGSIVEWDCWREEVAHSPNCATVAALELGVLPTYAAKYPGKIYLYMNDMNGSAAWFFITYMIYAFGGDIIRYSETRFGQRVKFGTIGAPRGQLVLVGRSSTTSGDGNATEVKADADIRVHCPTEQFLDSSVKKTDYNRFWVE